MSLHEQGAITGVGETQYMRGTDRTPLSLQLEASLNAIADAGLKPTDIDGVIPYGHGAVAEDFITNFGIPDLRFSATTPMGAPARSPPSSAPSPRSAPASATTCCCRSAAPAIPAGASARACSRCRNSV
jgi:acetyl-CoA acetyltransferase